MVSDLLIRARALLGRRSVERDLDDELSFHVRARTEQLVAAGESPRAAERIARLEFGGVEQIAEECREARGVQLLTELTADLRYAFRQLRRSISFAVLAVACLAFGIGANTAMFSVVNTLLFRPMPVADPSRLVLLLRGPEASLPYDSFRRYSSSGRFFSDLAVSMPMESDVDVNGSSSFAGAEVVSGNYGRTFGVNLAIGRWFTTDDEPSAVISYATWKRYFNLDARAIGSAIRSESQVYTIVGVASPGFSGVFAPIRTDIWVPLRTRPSIAAQLEAAPYLRVMIFGRLRQDADVRQAMADLNTIDTADGSVEREPTPRLPLTLEDFHGVPNPRMRMAARAGSILLMGVAVLILGIACLNVGNLLLVRGAARGHEIGIRRALGAGRGRIVRQLLTETMLLAAAGAVGGIALADASIRVLAAVLPRIPSTFANEMEFAIDRRVLLFAAVVSVCTVLVSGLRPAWLASRGAPIVTRAGTQLSYRRPISIVTQVTLSLVLLLVCGMFVRTLIALESTDPGFATENRLYASTFTPSPTLTTAARRQFNERAVVELGRLPGVLQAAVTDTLPLLPIGSTCVANGATTLRATFSSIDASYISTMAIGLLQGRSFDSTDRADAAPVAIINEALARELWPDGGAIGAPMVIGCGKSGATTIVGVVRNSAVQQVAEVPRPHVYGVFSQTYGGGVSTIVLHTAGAPETMAESVRRTLRGLGQDIRIYQVEPLAGYVERSHAGLRWASSVLGFFGVMALVLAAFGLFGIMAFRVTLRTREIGTRMAVGATRFDVLRHVMGWGLGIVVIGVVIGELLALPLARVVASLQVGARTPDIATHAAAIGIWLVAGLLGCLAPALRACAINPIAALRQE